MQLRGMIKKCGSALLRRGFKPKDVLAVILPNIPEYPVITNSATAIGGIITTINPRYTEYELIHQLKDSGASYIITVEESVDKVKNVSAKLGINKLFVIGKADGFESFSSLLDDDGSLFQIYEPVDWKDEVMLLLYSSGTTGLPKGVMVTHYNAIAYTIMASRFTSFTSPKIKENGVMLGLSPMYHSYGIKIVLGLGLYLGYKIVSMGSFELEAFLKTVQDYKITALTIVPPIALLLAKHPMVCKFDLACVQSVVCGAAPLGEDVVEQLKTRFPQIDTVRQGYGMTEMATIMITPPGEIGKPGSVGVPLPNLQVKVLDLLESGSLLGPGQDGEICIKGPTVMKGYLNKPEATANTIDKDGWLHTGDVGHYDEDDHFFIVDRVKELIKYKGFQVPPAQLEDILLSHPQITDAAVIGIPDVEAGELPKAFVVTRATLTGKEVSEFVAEKVAPYKKLRGGVEFVDTIPKSASGKILRRLLKEKEKAKIKS